MFDELPPWIPSHAEHQNVIWIESFPEEMERVHRIPVRLILDQLLLVFEILVHSHQSISFLHLKIFTREKTNHNTHDQCRENRKHRIPKIAHSIESHQWIFPRYSSMIGLTF